MIDTLVLTIPCTLITFTNPDGFQPSLSLIQNRTGYFKAILNASKADEQSGIYLPRLTFEQRYIHGGLSKILRIEFSAPKIVFQNNFDELTTADLPVLLNRLQECLKNMDVLVSEDSLETAEVSRIDYSKNLIFTDGTTARNLIQLIAKANVSRRLEVRKSEYMGDGLAFRWHTNSYEVIWYDKQAELASARRSQRGRIEKDGQSQATPVISDISNLPFEMLRIEVRLNKRAKVRAMLKLFHLEDDLRLCTLFDENFSQNFLIHYWNIMEKSLPPQVNRIGKVKEDLFRHQTKDPGRTLRSALAINAFDRLVDEEGSTGARAIIEQLAYKESWYRLRKESDNNPSKGVSDYRNIGLAGEQLARMEPVRLNKLDLAK